MQTNNEPAIFNDAIMKALGGYFALKLDAGKSLTITDDGRLAGLTHFTLFAAGASLVIGGVSRAPRHPSNMNLMAFSQTLPAGNLIVTGDCFLSFLLITARELTGNEKNYFRALLGQAPPTVKGDVKGYFPLNERLPYFPIYSFSLQGSTAGLQPGMRIASAALPLTWKGRVLSVGAGGAVTVVFSATFLRPDLSAAIPANGESVSVPHIGLATTIKNSPPVTWSWPAVSVGFAAQTAPGILKASLSGYQETIFDKYKFFDPADSWFSEGLSGREPKTYGLRFSPGMYADLATEAIGAADFTVGCTVTLPAAPVAGKQAFLWLGVFSNGSAIRFEYETGGLISCSAIAGLSNPAYTFAKFAGKRVTLMLSRRGSDISFYINGELVSAAALPPGNTFGPDGIGTMFLLGAAYPLGVGSWPGFVDGFTGCIHDYFLAVGKGLRQKEAALLWNNGSPRNADKFFSGSELKQWAGFYPTGPAGTVADARAGGFGYIGALQGYPVYPPNQNSIWANLRGEPLEQTA